MSQIKIVNVIASSKLNLKIQIEKLARSIRGAIYEPETFPGMHYRLQNNHGTVTIFASGKIVSTGTKSEIEAKNAIHNAVFEVEEILKLKLKVSKIKIENIVSTINLEKQIKIEKLTKKLIGSRLNFKEFPCIFYNYKEKATLLIFRSGKIVSVGAKNEKNSKESLKFIKSIIG